jgi:hypothetical protein
MHCRLASPLVIEQETKEAGLIRYALSSLFDPLPAPVMQRLHAKSAVQYRVRI